MKSLCVLVVLASACTKPDDVPALHDEAHATVAHVTEELDHLDDQFKALKNRGEQLKVYYPGSDEAGMLVTITFKETQALRHELDGAEQRIKAATTPDELRARIDAYEDVAEHGAPATKEHPPIPGIPALGSALTTVESWLTHTEAVKAAGSAMLPP